VEFQLYNLPINQPFNLLLNLLSNLLHCQVYNLSYFLPPTLHFNRREIQPFHRQCNHPFNHLLNRLHILQISLVEYQLYFHHVNHMDFLLLNLSLCLPFSRRINLQMIRAGYLPLYPLYNLHFSPVLSRLLNHQLYRQYFLRIFQVVNLLPSHPSSHQFFLLLGQV